MKKLLSITICLMLTTAAVGQTIQQKGVAYKYNGKQKRTPLGNVTITYDAGKRTVLSAEQNGTFTLTLEGRRMGDKIGAVTVKKREMTVFNQQAVDEWNVRKEPLMLILCNADDLDRQKENLIAIGRRQAKKKYDLQKAELEKQLQDSRIKQQEYETALDKAYEELERFQKSVGEYADLFARIDESEVDTLTQRAIDLFNQGEVDEAIRLFEEGHYMEKLDKALKTSQQADELKAVAEQAKAKATQDSLQALQSLKAQIEAYKLNNDWDKAGELLKGLADRLNTVDDCGGYAYYCLDQNNFKEAETYYLRAIALLEQQTDKESMDYQSTRASLLNNLAILYNNTQQFSESEAMSKEALEIRRRLAANNPQIYEPDVATTLNNLAKLYIDIQRLDESEAMFKEALEIRRRLTLSNPQAYESDLAGTLNNLANLYKTIQRFSESEAMYKEALDIYRRLAANNPRTYEPDVAMTLDNLANLYDNIQRLDESEAMHREALEIRRRLAANNPQAYEPAVALTLYNFAYLYLITQRFSESEAMYKESLDIRRRLAANNPQAYESDVALTLNTLAFLYSNTQRFSESEATYKEALAIYRRLAVNNPQTYEPAVANTLGCLSYNDIILKQYAEAEKLAREALILDPSQHWIMGNLAASLLFQGKYDEAEKIYRQYKDELKDSFLNDFQQFAEAGVIPKEREADVEKIKRMLNE